MNIIHQKCCRKCGIWKPHEEFYVDRRAKDGRFYWCKDCTKQDALARRNADPERARTRDREWKRNNPDKRAAQRKRYYERLRQDEDRYASYLEGRRTYKHNLPAEVKERRAERDRQTKRYLLRTPEQKREAARRRLSRLNFSGSYTIDEWLDLCDWFGNVCLCCGAKEVVRDHVIPLSLGGVDALTNLQPLCSKCNTRKGGTQITDYRDPKRLVEFLKRWQAQKTKQSA